MLFIFSLDLMKIFKILPNNYAIYCYDNTGPFFSKGSLYVPNSFFNKYGKTSINGGPFQFEKNYNYVIYFILSFVVHALVTFID